MSPRLASLRFLCGAVLLVAMSLYAAGRKLPGQALRDWRNAGKDDEALAADARFAPMREALAGRKRAGFVTEIPSGTAHQWVQQQHRLFLARYSLAPVVLRSGGKGQRVIGDFRLSAGERPSIPAQLQVEQNLGDGLLVLKGSEQ